MIPGDLDVQFVGAVKRLKGVVSQDHVHVLVSAPPNMAPSEIMRRIKGRSSAKLFVKLPGLEEARLEAPFLGSRILLRNVKGADRRNNSKLFGPSF